MVHSKEEMAGVLNVFFAGVVTREGTEPVPAAKTMRCQKKLESCRITAEKIKEKIKEPADKLRSRPDKIGPGLLQNLLEEVTPVMEIIFRRSLEEEEVPEDWRSANMTPIFKKGAKSDLCNYRPVSLTTVCCKVLESIISDDLMEHLLGNDLLKSSQHGFIVQKVIHHQSTGVN